MHNYQQPLSFSKVIHATVATFQFIFLPVALYKTKLFCFTMFHDGKQKKSGFGGKMAVEFNHEWTKQPKTCCKFTSKGFTMNSYLMDFIETGKRAHAKILNRGSVLKLVLCVTLLVSSKDATLWTTASKFYGICC